MFLLIILTSYLGSIPSSFSARNYVVETTETWNGHVYKIKNEQPFFRVYHMPHFKVAREKPTDGKLTPEQMQLAEEQESDWRLRMSAAMFSTKDPESIERKLHPENGIAKVKGTSDEIEPLPEFLAEEQMQNSTRKNAKFGHHHLPQGEQQDSVKWPWELWPYIHCLTIQCECPLFKGVVVGDQCILPSGKPLKRAIRKEFRQLTAEEYAIFLEAMQKFRDSGLYTRFGMIHRRSGVHSGPSFFPWHREFLKRLEMVFRTFYPPHIEPTLGLPYWDSSLDNNLPAPEDSIMFSDILMGRNNEHGEVITGPFSNWTTMDGRYTYIRMFGSQTDGEFANQARIDWVMQQTEIDRVLAYSLPTLNCLNYTMDDRFLEYTHDYVHYFISGDMLERYSSSNDPLFFMHHGFIDSIWEEWRQTKQTRNQRERDYPRDDGECMPEWHFSYRYMPMLQPMRNIDALSNNYTDHLYEYAPRPSCKGGASEECKSEYLFCDTRSEPENPVCSAKVRPGGNCTGFEWSTEVCHQGECIDGRCKTSGSTLPPRKFDANKPRKLQKNPHMRHQFM